MRIDFQNKPEKFQNSEIELDEILQKFFQLSAYPEFFPTFTNSTAP